MLDPHAGFRVPHADPYVKLFVRSTHQLQTQVGGDAHVYLPVLGLHDQVPLLGRPTHNAANALQLVGLQTALLPNWLCSCPYLNI